MMPMIGMTQRKATMPTTMTIQRGARADHFAPAVRWTMAGIETISTATQQDHRRGGAVAEFELRHRLPVHEIADRLGGAHRPAAGQDIDDVEGAKRAEQGDEDGDADAGQRQRHHDVAHDRKRPGAIHVGRLEHAPRDRLDRGEAEHQRQPDRAPGGGDDQRPERRARIAEPGLGEVREAEHADERS